MSNPTQTTAVAARVGLLLVVLAIAASLVGSEVGVGAKRVVTARLIPARPADWAVSGAPMRIETAVDGQTGVPAVAVRVGDAPLRWQVEPRPHARLRFGYRLRRGEQAAAEPITVAVEWQAPSGKRTELYREEVRATPSDHAAEVIEIELPADGAGEVLLSATGGGERDGDAREGGAAATLTEVGEREDLLWIDPIVLAPDPTPPRNVVVICIDTLRADRFSLIGGGPSALPLTEKRLASAAVFRRAYSNAPWTLPSVSTVLTGLYPGLHNAGRRTTLGPSAGRPTNYSATPTEGGIQLTIAGKDYRFQMLHPSIPTLHAILGEQGYVTGAIFRNGYLNHPTRVFLGTDSFHHYRGFAPEGANHAINWIAEHRNEAFYLFLHFIDPHQWPRRLKKELRGKRFKEFSDEDRREVWRVYNQLASETDVNVDRVFRALANQKLLDDTYVILLADHGERFFEKGTRGSHGGDHYENVLRVPLAIWGPGLSPLRIDSRVSLADVAPTVLDLLGVATDDRFSGSSLVPLLSGQQEERSVLSEFILWNDPQTALLRDGWKYIRRESREELYFLPDDPTESHNRIDSEPDVLRAMRSEVDEHVSEADRHFANLTYGTTQLDSRTVGSLRALGYLE
jgi:arylsulfatase A-like enzyme